MSLFRGFFFVYLPNPHVDFTNNDAFTQNRKSNCLFISPSGIIITNRPFNDRLLSLDICIETFSRVYLKTSGFGFLYFFHLFTDFEGKKHILLRIFFSLPLFVFFCLFDFHPTLDFLVLFYSSFFLPLNQRR